MTPRLHKIDANGMELAVWEWSGPDPPLLLCHATGFHARIWDQIVARLGARHVYSVDMRGHGLSSKPAPPYAWRDFGADIAELAEALHLRGALGGGHSMGGYALALAAALRPESFAALVLADPVIRAPKAYIGPLAEPHYAGRRRNRWTSWEEMYERFKPRAPFSSWNDAVLRDYCRHALIADSAATPPGEGAWVLACPPEIEASIYENSPAAEADISAEIARVEIPVAVMRAPRQHVPGTLDMAASPTDPALASRFRRGRDLVMHGHSHFIPMESPDAVAGLILEMAADYSGGPAA